MSGSGVSYDVIIGLALFFICQWYAGKMSKTMNVSTIPAEIGVGLLFGPNGFDFIPQFSHHYSPLMLLGFIGVSLVIFESGMHLNIKKVCNWKIGGYAVVVAIIGTIFPICAGMAAFVAFGYPYYPNGLAAGFALAPTSVGISLALLSRAKELNTRCGQIVMSAAFVDDILSIICLVILTHVAKGEFQFFHSAVVPFLYAFAFVGVGSFVSVFFMPNVMNKILSHCEDQGDTQAGRNLKDQIHFTILVAMYLFLSWVGTFVGSALLGSFVAGTLFNTVPRSTLLWHKHTKHFIQWLLRLFFSCTVAFSIHVSDLFSAEAFWRGVIVAVLPCLGTKLFSGIFVGVERWVVGVAMMARGEFAYLVAEQGYALDMITGTQYAIIVWALLWATVLSPLFFDYTLHNYVAAMFKRSDQRRSHRIGGKKYSGEPSFIIRLIGNHHCGMVREVVDSLHSLGFDVLQSVTESDGTFGTGTFVVIPRDPIVYNYQHGHVTTESRGGELPLEYRMATDLSDDKLDEIEKNLKETIADKEAQVIFEPCGGDKEDGNQHIVEIELFGENYRNVLKEITDFLMHSCALNIIKAYIDEPEDTELAIDYCVFYCTKKKSNRSDSLDDSGRKKWNEQSDQASPSRKTKESTESLSSDTEARPHDADDELDAGIELNSVKGSVSGSGTACEDRPDNSPTMRSQIDTRPLPEVTEEERAEIRQGIRRIYAEHGLHGGEALVRMVHEDDVIYSINMKTLHSSRGKRSDGDTTSRRRPSEHHKHGLPNKHIIKVDFANDPEKRAKRRSSSNQSISTVDSNECTVCRDANEDVILSNAERNV